jgi:hypothetical protein
VARVENLLDATLSRLFGALGFRKCSKCYVRTRRAQLLWWVTAPFGRFLRRSRLRWRQTGWPERFELRKVADIG